MDLLILVLGSEIILISLIIILIILLIEILKMLRKINRNLIRVWRLLKKIVVSVAVVSVKTDAASYEHTGTVNISGLVTLEGVPQSGKPVNLTIADISGVTFSLPDATTGTDGTFTAAWIIPPEVAPGVCTLTATAMGMTVTSTFTFKLHIRMRHPRFIWR